LEVRIWLDDVTRIPESSHTRFFLASVAVQ
jgi:hypothetical protein